MVVTNENLQFDSRVTHTHEHWPFWGLQGRLWRIVLWRCFEDACTESICNTFIPRIRLDFSW